MVQPRLSFPLLDASFGLVRPAPVFPKPFVLPKPLKAPKVPKATKVPKPVFSTDVKAVFGSAPSKAKTTQQSKVIAPIIVQKPVKAPITVQKPHPTSHQLSGFLKTQSVHGAGLKSFPVNGSGLKIHSVQGAGPLGFKIPVVQKSELGGDPAFQRPPSFYNPIDDLDPLLIENKRQSLLFKLKPLNLENLSKLPTEIRQIQGLHHFLTVFGKPLLCWADAIPNFGIHYLTQLSSVAGLNKSQIIQRRY